METLFYDGGCGLCHHAVRFLLWADREGTAFRFAPLGGETFLRAISTDARVGLPDSLLLRMEDGRLLARSDAVRESLRALGGFWRALGVLLGAVPRPVRDAAYDTVARVRHRLFAPPPAACPRLPTSLRARFLP